MAGESKPYVHPVEHFRKVRSIMQRDISLMTDPVKAFENAQTLLMEAGNILGDTRIIDPLLTEMVDTMRTILAAHGELYKVASEMRSILTNAFVQPAAEPAAVVPGGDPGPAIDVHPPVG